MFKKLIGRFAPRHPAPAEGPEVFRTAEARAINEARLCHLASLGLELAGRKVLEVGGGIGLHTCFFESLGCEVLFTDARADNVREVQRGHPGRATTVLDLDVETDLSRLGMFDIIYCYGTLYHLRRPAEALAALARICRHLMLLETCVTPGEGDAPHPEPEPASNPNQAASGLGCRPTRTWVMRRLAEQFGHAYQTRTQPPHPDFELNWLQPAPRKLYRAVFVGAKEALALPALSDVLCDVQNPVPDDTRGVWLDVGAHLGETTFTLARARPDLRVFAFEPNVTLAAQRWQALPNYVVLPMAVAESNGVTAFHLNANTAASSLLELDPERLGRWVGGGDLKATAEAMVPTTRLDTFLAAVDLRQVDYLKIDAQGADFAVVRSAGERLAEIRKIKLEVSVTPTPLYVGTASKEEIVAYLAARGFALIAEEPQTHGQEENLTFFRLGPAAGDLRPVAVERLDSSGAALEPIVRALPDERLLAVAGSVAWLRPLGPYPGWSFAGAERNPDPPTQLRHLLWQACAERRLEKPLVFPWYGGLRLNLYLGNDMSRPTFIGGCIEPNEFAFLEAILQPGMVMIDVGANDGFFTLFAAWKVGPAGRVYAFEPSQREFARLQANLRLNGLANVEAVPKALAAAAGTAQLRLAEYGHEGQNTLGDFAHDVRAAGFQTVELASLDVQAAAAGLTRLDVIKLDAEGAEHKVLSGARATLARFKPLILLELLDGALRHQGSSAAAVLDLLRELGYLVYEFAPATGRPVACTQIPRSDNIIATPRPLDPLVFP